MLSERWQKLIEKLPPEIKLLAVSKGQPHSSITQLAELGQVDFGESRLQEALPKIEALNDIEQLRWHFIGRLQANKVRKVLKTFQFIHSVDSLSLAERISRIAVEESIRPDLLLQVKLREDLNKGGFDAHYLREVWPNVKSLPNVRFIGLMTIAPRILNLEERKTLFLDCRKLADQFQLPECSMGMSQDWQEALETGATWLRLGSVLFGPRQMGPNSSTDITKTD